MCVFGNKPLSSHTHTMVSEVGQRVEEMNEGLNRVER